MINFNDSCYKTQGLFRVLPKDKLVNCEWNHRWLTFEVRLIFFLPLHRNRYVGMFYICCCFFYRVVTYYGIKVRFLPSSMGLVSLQVERW
jgi:hypothetical protein